MSQEERRGEAESKETKPVFPGYVKSTAPPFPGIQSAPVSAQRLLPLSLDSFSNAS